MPEPFDEKAVFLAALGLGPQDREAFLRGACPDQAARARIESLLRHHAEGTTAFGGASVTSAEPSELGSIDEFKIVRTLGHGGMGVVYLAEDTVLGRPVALKVLAGHLTGSEQALARFRDEARNAAALKHPSIVQVYKFGFDGHDHYIASEYVEGCTLVDLIAQERIRRASQERAGTQAVRDWHTRIATIVAQIADALDCSHRAKIIHRDVKPSNILIDRAGLARLTDFGIAKHLVEDARTRHTGVIGSCHYMSPEQAAIAGAKVDQRSDVFSLGVVLYEAIALRRPFEGSDVQQVLRAVTSTEPVRLGSVDRLVGRDLETICHKAIEKDPASRYQTAAHMAADLRCYLAGDPILARPPGVGRRSARLLKRYRGPVIAGGCVVLVLAAAGAWAGLVRARDRAMAWVSVESEAPDCRVYRQGHDAQTLELVWPAVQVGTAPVRHVGLAPGQYRITVVTARGDAFVEFNAILLSTGREHETALLAQGPREDAGAGAPATPAVDSGTVLRGVLRPTSQATGEFMFSIPAGAYVFGWNDTGDAIRRRRTATLPAFWMDRTEVSNRDYKRFVDATGYRRPRHWADYGYEASAADLPVVGITMEDAEAYARWRGGRLPTMHEWQAAARGPEGRRFPWGDDYREGVGVTEPGAADLIAEQSWQARDLYDVYLRKATGTQTPGEGDGPGPFLHMFDNVREMSGTANLPQRDLVILGRCWADSARYADLSRAWSYPLGGFSFKQGFRCAKSAAPATVEASPMTSTTSAPVSAPSPTDSATTSTTNPATTLRR